MRINSDKLLFLDIETVSEEREFGGLSEDKKRLWVSLSDVFEKRVVEPEKLDEIYSGGDVSHSVLYRYTAALYAEFSKVCCVSMAFLTKEGEIRYESYSGNDEKEILTNARKILDKTNSLGFSLCGTNIKNFDIPFLGKRYLINGLKPPKLFPTYDTKPWDLKVVDIKEVWSFGGKYGLNSLDIMCTSMGVHSTKNDIVNGETIHDYFWDGDYESIKDHCERDVKSSIDIIQKINNLK